MKTIKVHPRGYTLIMDGQEIVTLNSLAEIEHYCEMNGV